ncbi:hypothetical protein GJAV_G00217280 [Gymnothorax javanicus]|nr:hypothetical protein GJAV_G00217280 [Gymnothorax javanicus]
MVTFQDVLRQVRRYAEEASPEEVRSLLDGLMEVQVLSRDYYQLLAQEGDFEDLIRRISLPIWQNWDVCNSNIQLLLHRLQSYRDSEDLCDDSSTMQGICEELPELLDDLCYEDDWSLSAMQDIPLEFPEHLEDLCHEEDLSAYFPGDLLNLPDECFSPIAGDDSLDIDIHEIIQSLSEGQEGYSVDTATVPPSPAESEQVEQETNDGNSSNAKRGLPSYMTSGDPMTAKCSRRDSAVPRGPRTRKSRDRKHGLRKTCDHKSPVSSDKTVVTAAAPGIVRLDPCTVPQILQVFVPTSGGPSFQVIQTFATVPPQMVNIPVSNAVGSGGPTYVLVPSPAVVPRPLVMPQSPVAGTVVPPNLTVTTPLGSSLDSANKSSSCASVPSLSPETVAGAVVPPDLTITTITPSSPSDSATKSLSCASVPSLSPETEVLSSKVSKSPTSQVPPNSDIPRHVKEYIESAKSLMRDVCKNMTSETGVPFESLYVDVGVVRRQLQVNMKRNVKRCLEKQLVMLGDGDRRRATLGRRQIFEEGVGQRRIGASIALLGKSGAGKTAFIHRLCLDWADGSLPRFDFLFLLEGRALNVPRAEFSLRNLLFDISASFRLSQDSDVGFNVEIIFGHILRHPQRVLIIFDNCDDFRDCECFLQSPATSASKEDYSAKQLFSGLFQRKLLAGCTLLLAGRPKEVLNPLLGKVDRILELRGFSPTEVEIYVSRYFARSPCHDQALKRLQEGSYALRLCSNPFLCQSVCYLLDRQAGKRALPSTLTGLLEAVTYHRLCTTDLGKKRGMESWRQNVVQLCRAAWEGMKVYNSQLPLQSELSPDEQHALVAGGGILLPFTRQYDKEELKPSECGYRFDHLLTQSFLAAMHLALSQEVSSRALVAQFGGQTRKRKLPAAWLDAMNQFAMGLIFQKKALFLDCFVNAEGMTKSRGTAAKQAAVSAYLKKLRACELSPAKLLELCHCIFEVGDAKLATFLNKSLPCQLSFSGAQLEPPDVFVLHQLLILNPKRSFSLNLQDTGISICGLRELLGLKCISSFRASIGDVISLWEDLQKTNEEALLKSTVSKFTINPLKVTRLSHLNELALLLQIYREKRLPSCDSSQSDPILDNDSFSIPAVRSLQRLDLELGAQNGPSGFSKLVKCLPDLQWLQHLDLEDNKIGDSGAEMLAEVLPKLTSLEMLNLSQNCIGDGGVAKLAPALPSLPSLLYLSLYSNLFGDSGAQNLASVLPQMKSLADLDVKYNKFSDSGAMELSESMRSCPWIKTIGMWNHFIPHGVLERLRQQDSRIRIL